MLECHVVSAGDVNIAKHYICVVSERYLLQFFVFSVRRIILDAKNNPRPFPSTCDSIRMQMTHSHTWPRLVMRL